MLSSCHTLAKNDLRLDSRQELKLLTIDRQSRTVRTQTPEARRPQLESKLYQFLAGSGVT